MRGSLFINFFISRSRGRPNFSPRPLVKSCDFWLEHRLVFRKAASDWAYEVGR